MRSNSDRYLPACAYTHARIHHIAVDVVYQRARGNRFSRGTMQFLPPGHFLHAFELRHSSAEKRSAVKCSNKFHSTHRYFFRICHTSTRGHTSCRRTSTSRNSRTKNRRRGPYPSGWVRSPGRAPGCRLPVMKVNQSEIKFIDFLFRGLTVLKMETAVCTIPLYRCSPVT